MPYTSEEIKKQLDDAVKKIRASAEAANAEKQKTDGIAAQQSPAEAANAEELETDGAAAQGTAGAAGAEEPQPDSIAEQQSPAPEQSEPEDSGAPAKPDPASGSTASKNPWDAVTKKPAAKVGPAAGRKPSQDRRPGRAPARKPAPMREPAPTIPPNPEHHDAAPGKGGVRSFDISPEGALTERPGAGPSADADLDTGPDDFKISFDFDSAYRDVPENKPLRFRREKRTGCVGGILYSVFVICISLVLAVLAWLAASDVLGFGTSDELVYITVEKGFDIEDIIEKLYDSGLIKYKSLFRIYADYSKAEEKIAAGSYALNKNYDYRAIVHGMTARGGVLEETRVTIPEGLTLAEIFMRLEDYGVCAASDLWETAANYDFNYSFLDKSTLGERHRLEGFLFPDTHNFYLDSSPVLVIDKFLNEFDNRFTETYIERAEFMGYSIRDIITIASMIEREAGSDEERPRIAAVIYNRLNNSTDFPFLQIDSTIVYAMAGTSAYSSDFTEFESPYNTYLHEGLPPGPIANPGFESIRAALYPSSTDEYYYALNTSGTHEFFRTLAQHEAFVASDEFG